MLDKDELVVAFSSLARIWENVRPFIPSLRYFSNCFFLSSGDSLAHTNFALYARLSPQVLSELRRQKDKVVLFDMGKPVL